MERPCTCQDKMKTIFLTPDIRMSHWHHTMVDGAEFWISCQRPNLLRKPSHWQLIQNLAPSTIVWHQCDIRMYIHTMKSIILIKKTQDWSKLTIHAVKTYKTCVTQRRDMQFSLVDYWIRRVNLRSLKRPKWWQVLLLDPKSHFI